jgi:predicted DNA-binding helix-hairpin-helix protein
MITQCNGIPPGEVMQLLLAADSNQDFDLEKKLQELFKKYNEKS